MCLSIYMYIKSAEWPVEQRALAIQSRIEDPFVSYDFLPHLSFMMFDATWNLIRRNVARHNVLEDLDTDRNKQNLTW